ncbi:MAG TPA: hypothetical protein VFA86_13610 [Gammaproteobacteria bacterium]|nr:hypothetical protein [Gammaproteobacteria bacterium]
MSERRDRRNGRRAFAWTWAIAALTVLAGLFVGRRADFAVEGLFGFYAVAGLVSSALIAAGGALIARLAGRGEDYYDG